MSQAKAMYKRRSQRSNFKRRKSLYPKKDLSKGKFDASYSQITFMPKNTRNMFTPRWRTKCTAQFYGSTTTGVGSGDYSWVFKLNSPITPLDGSNSGLTINNLNKLTYFPAGFTQLCNDDIYAQGRVYASSIEIDIVP